MSGSHSFDFINVFALAVKHDHYTLVFVGVFTSVISLGYYLKLIVAAYMEKPTHTGSVTVMFTTRAVIGVSAIITVLLGLLPGGAIEFFLETGK